MDVICKQADLPLGPVSDEMLAMMIAFNFQEDKFNETTKKSVAMVQQECKHFQELDKDALKLQ